LKAINLLCEYSSNPIGLDEKKPRFSWEVEVNDQGKFQSAYQILVASSREEIQNNHGDVWDSGKVKSEQSVNNVFEGKLLESGEKYFWKVKIWDEKGKEGLTSDISTFEMGLLNPKDWEGYWIEQDDEEIKGPLFRKDFIIEKDIKRARAYVTGLGYYELRLNGEKVGEEVLDPGWTGYDKRILYTTHDITEGLKKGKNAVGIMLGNGRYSPDEEYVKKTASVNPLHSLQVFGEKPVALLQINIEFCDGSKVSIYTDNNWKVVSGPITFNDIFKGEVYNARLEKEGWDLPEFDDSEWEPAIKTDPQPVGKLVSQATFPPIKICKTLYPEKITSPKPGVYIYDFGQNFTGWVRFKGKAAEGTEVKIRYAELLADDGMLNTLPNRFADATDVYIFKGEGEEVYEPRFTYHGFRYVEVTGYPGTPSLENIKGRVVHTAVAKTGNFYCDNDLINKIHNNILWGQESNLMSIPTDCPQRDERMGWMGDAQLVAEEAVYNFNMVGFYTKWLADVRDAQLEDGSVPDVVPPYWSRYPADPAWGTACVTIPWYVYLFYNDLRILEKNYGMMKKWVDYLEDNAEDNVLQKLGKCGDWCPPWHVLSVDTPLELVSTWYYYHDTLVFSKIAAILGKEDISEKYEARAAKIKDAFNERFLEEDCYSGVQYEWYERMVSENASEEEKERRRERRERLSKTFDVESQTSNILPLYLNMVPEEKREQVKDTLLHNIQIVHHNHLNTGIVGTRYIMDVLTDIGYHELAYKLVTQTTYPSWGYMIKEGATTLWERWQYMAGAGMNSHNHIMLGTVDSWFYKALAGINLDLSSPGFEEIVIKPILLDGMNLASASLNTVRGVISSRWRKCKDSLTLEVVIPGNCMARVYIAVLDDADDFVISEDEKNIWFNGSFEEKEGIVSGNREGDYVVFTVKPGSYKFVCKNK